MAVVYNVFNNGLLPMKLDVNSKLSPIAYYLKSFDSSFYMDYHSHNYIEFMYCISGEFTFSFFDQKAKSYKDITILEGQLLYINPNLKHKIIIEKNAHIANIEIAIINNFDVSLEQSINYSLFFRNHLKRLYKEENNYFIVKDQFGIKEEFTKLIIYLEDQIEKDFVDQSMNILSFFYAIKKSIGANNKGDYSFIHHSIIYIKDNLNSNLTIESLAARANVSPSYFAHMFKMSKGVSVLKYINNLRIDRARWLLKNSSLPINEIAVQVGYKNKNRLNYQFHAMLKCSPREYKNSIDLKEIDKRLAS